MTGNTVEGSNIISGLSALPQEGQTIAADGVLLADTIVGFILGPDSIAISWPALTTTSGTTFTLTGGTTPTPTAPGFLLNIVTTGALRGSTVISGGFSSRSRIESMVFLTDVLQGLTVKDIIDDILMLWGIQFPSLAFRFQMKRAIHDLNGAMQMIWALAKNNDYFSRNTITVTFPADTESITLPPVLGVLGPARFASNRQPLRPISSRGQFDSFGPAFLGATSYNVPHGTPLAFFIEKLNQPSPDNTENVMHLVPVPSADTDVLLDISVKCPRYDWNDYLRATPVEMPNEYADSVLIPFARYRAMSSQYFVQVDRRPAIIDDYQTAMKIIGAVDPGMKEVQFAEHASDKG